MQTMVIIYLFKTSGVCPLGSSIFGTCQTKPSSVLNMIGSAKNDSYAYQYIENFLYFANSTSPISFSFPNYIPILILHNYTAPGSIPQIWYTVYDYNTTGYGWTLIQLNQSTIYGSNGKISFSIIPSIPASGSQANIFAFYNYH